MCGNYGFAIIMIKMSLQYNDDDVLAIDIVMLYASQNRSNYMNLPAG